MSTMKMGFLGAGSIAEKMAKTIARIPEVETYAVAARDVDRARRFAKQHGFAKAYGSYEEMVSDPEVQLVYIATPHSHHYEHGMLCLKNAKHVLCEKAFTANAVQAKALLDFAKSQKKLIAEAIWTRYMPLSKKINEVINSGIIGSPTLVTANLGYPISRKNRIVDPALAGGALLDLSVYPINFASMIFGGDISNIASAAVMHENGVDAMDSITLCYAGGQMAVLNSTIYSRTDQQGMIYGDKGHLAVEEINNPTRIRVFDANNNEIGRYDAPPQISGYEYEVLSAVKAIEQGKLECPEMPHRETLRIMELCDGLRADWGIKFPFE